MSPVFILYKSPSKTCLCFDAPFGQGEELQWADAGVMGGGAASLTHAKGN